MAIFKVNLKKPNIEIIERAANTLKSGGLIVYPTDTAYGLGANALDENAVKKIYKIKGRDFSKPTHVVVRNWKMIENLCCVNLLGKKLYDKFLPGPLTLILPKLPNHPNHPNLPNLLTANLPTLGVRIPDNLITQSLSRLVNFPFTTPSANKSGGKTPYSIEEVKNELDISKIDLILDAGKLPKVVPSTIVDLTSKDPKILREGPIAIDEIQKLK